jgi:hypothetical protein
VGRTTCGFSQAGNGRDTLQERNAPEGEIPGALSARNKAGAGPGGANRQEGNQTLKAERSGLGKPASGGPPSLERAEGNRSPGEWPARSLRRTRRLGGTGKNSEGKAELEESGSRVLNKDPAASDGGKP